MTAVTPVIPEPDDFAREDPSDLGAERAVLGAMMLSAAAAAKCAAVLSAEDFYLPAHALVFAAITAAVRAGEPADPISVKVALESAGHLRGNLDAPYLHTLIASVPAVANALHYARIVRDRAVRRRLLTAARHILQWAGSGGDSDAHGLTERSLRELESVRDAGLGDGITVKTITEFLDVDESADDYDWIIPGLLERGDRLVVTGAEGAGKSSLLRQLAVTIAAGIHPFTHQAIEPKRVLLIDCENGERHMRRKLRPLRAQAALQYRPVSEANLWLEAKPAGMDLARDKDVSWLLRQVSAVRPDVVMVGPLYKLAPRALNDDSDAAPILAVLDMIRARDACLILEAHAGHGLAPGGGGRDFRPRGSAALMGWPEFGYGLRWSADPRASVARTVDMVSWRGDRDERDWPEMLTAGGVWPWKIATPAPKPKENDGWGAR